MWPGHLHLVSSRQRSPAQQAIFLDRDGTLVQDVGYLTNPAQLVVLPGSVEGIRLLQDWFLIIVVTNQSAIGRGLLDESSLSRIQRSLVENLHARGVRIDAIYSCPHHPRAGCSCRKPAPGMLVQASADFNIRLDRSYLIGDKGSDILAGKRAGVAATVLIPSHQTKHTPTEASTPAYVANGLQEAAKWILSHEKCDD